MVASNVSRTTITLVGVAWAFGATSSVAQPQDEQALANSSYRRRLEVIDFEDRRLLLGSMLGAGTPVGLIGGVAMYSAVDQVALGVGAGSNLSGLQFASMVTLRPLVAPRPNGAHAFTIMAAWSMGPWFGYAFEYGLGIDQQSVDWTSKRAHWFSFDGGYELVHRRGFWFRTAWGAAWMLNPADAYCLVRETNTRIDCGSHVIRGEAVLLFGFVFGYAVDL